VAEAILEHDLLARFEGRTTTDLYLFLSDHRRRLEREFGWSLDGPLLAGGFRAEFDLEEASGRLRAAVAAGQDGGRGLSHLIDVVLLVREAGDGEEGLRAALDLAGREGARLLALQVGEGPGDEASSKEAFAETSAAAGVDGQLAVAGREPLQAILDGAAYADV